MCPLTTFWSQKLTCARRWLTQYIRQYPKVNLARRGSFSVNAVVVAACLLWLQPLYHRQHRCMAQKSHIPGRVNTDLSRMLYLSDKAILDHLRVHYQQKLPWKMCQLSCVMTFALTLSLYKLRVPAESLTHSHTQAEAFSLHLVRDPTRFD